MKLYTIDILIHLNSTNSHLNYNFTMTFEVFVFHYSIYCVYVSLLIKYTQLQLEQIIAVSLIDLHITVDSANIYVKKFEKYFVNSL